MGGGVRGGSGRDRVWRVPSCFLLHLEVVNLWGRVRLRVMLLLRMLLLMLLLMMMQLHMARTCSKLTTGGIMSQAITAAT